MREFRLSKPADDDISNIAEYTIQQFDIEQARSYRDSLIKTLDLLAQNPRLGKSADDIRKGYQCHNHQSYAIYYKIEEDGILVIRVLHIRMDANRHLRAEEWVKAA